MTARDLKTLLADGESEETIKDALNSLDAIEPMHDKAMQDLQALRIELTEELGTIQATQGQLL